MTPFITSPSLRRKHTASLLVLCTCLPWPAIAQTVETSSLSPEQIREVTPPEQTQPALLSDSTILEFRSGVRNSVEWLASGVDSWFGDIPFSEGGKITDGEIGLTLYKREDEPKSLGLRFKARFTLPNLESYQYLFVGNDDRRAIVSDQPDTFTRQQQLLRREKRDNAFFAGIGATLRDNLDVRLGFRGGLKPYGQVRYRHIWNVNPNQRLEFRETLFYSIADRFGSTTALTYEYALSPGLTARWLHAITATEKSRSTNWSSSAGVFKSFGRQRQLSLEALFNGEIGQPVRVQDYGLQTKWSQPIHKDYVVGELVVGHFWPRKDPLQNRTRAWAMGAGVTLKF